MRNVTKRSIPLGIVFSIITCGIYLYYWIYSINEDIKAITQDNEATSGGMVILFSLLTCGIYQFYWLYKMGEKVDSIKNNPNGHSGILYMILSLFGLGIVSICFIQDEINNTCIAKENEVDNNTYYEN